MRKSRAQICLEGPARVIKLFRTSWKKYKRRRWFWEVWLTLFGACFSCQRFLAESSIRTTKPSVPLPHIIRNDRIQLHGASTVPEHRECCQVGDDRALRECREPSETLRHVFHVIQKTVASHLVGHSVYRAAGTKLSLCERMHKLHPL